MTDNDTIKRLEGILRLLDGYSIQVVKDAIIALRIELEDRKEEE